MEAAQTRVVMKDGRLYVGHFSDKSVVEPVETKKRDSAPIQSEKIIVVDDQLRRIYIPKRRRRPHSRRPAAALEVFKIRQQVNENPNTRIAALGS